ncbi:BLUF domain-containing protein [Polymorphobacter fuscus]|uniref:BLUF domain-containing protein n=1 Tax=Sandarakinorhabdus fusca TaxID=1439888 RepID=A0A7C9KWB8_9SPHN|nr:BLUF domain-containing protein [Polymorphobacter fuscus]KAB7648314.1 BLUF domain-containing protein [Polymorphobacter fuscus]MQT15826.1 hypothetical protein [Polymorphobacter fuscus]NJC07900.1 hypothetical protein [Polymorphobacter fuscus]
MISLIYSSQGLIFYQSPFYFQRMATLLAQCFDKNVKLRITGILGLSNGRFMQVLEGPTHSVEDMFAAICRDPRHFDVRLISTRSIAERRFGSWSMAFVGPPVNIEPVFDMIDPKMTVAHEDIVTRLASYIRC